MLIYGLWNRPPSAVEIAVGVGLLALYWVLGHLVDPGTMAERTSRQLSGWASRYQQAMAKGARSTGFQSGHLGNEA